MDWIWIMDGSRMDARGWMDPSIDPLDPSWDGSIHGSWIQDPGSIQDLWMDFLVLVENCWFKWLCSNRSGTEPQDHSVVVTSELSPHSFCAVRPVMVGLRSASLSGLPAPVVSAHRS